MKFDRTHFCASLLLASLLLGACKDKSAVKVYRVAKAEPETSAPQAAAAAAPESSGMGGMGNGMIPPMGAPSDAMAPAAQPSQVTGTPPPNWEVQPLSTMRQASYLVKGENGATADISLVALAGPAGGVLDNVNRWLSQLGQPAITGEQLAQKGQKATSPLGDVTVVDLEGLPEGADASKDGRIIAGIVTVEGKSWFFKMRGNAALAASQKEGFVRWISTVQVRGDASPPDALAPAAHSASPASSATPDTVAAPAAGPEQLKWVVPAGWKPAAPKAMRHASFAVAGQNGESADISVSVFGGDGGGDLANVNRWRSQIGLGDVDAGGLKSLIVPVSGKDNEILTVDMAGPKARILAGWAKIGARTWFFKLIAPDGLAGSEKAAFVKFLESVQFQP